MCAEAAEVTDHESAHALFLESLLFLLLFALGVGVPVEYGLVELADLQQHGAMVVLELFSVLHHCVQELLCAKPQTYS